MRSLTIRAILHADIRKDTLGRALCPVKFGNFTRSGLFMGLGILYHLRVFRHNNFVSRFAATRQGKRWKSSNDSGPPAKTNEADNPLREFFSSRRRGRGIWKWEHYFDIYHRHFSAFRDKPITVLEIGVLGGGSLDMWRQYFGPHATLIGVDIDPTCKAYETAGTEIFIGNQGDRTFWKDFRKMVPKIDIVIDDGSHMSRHQITSMEELLPCVSPGGVYLCEDVHGESNAFSCYVQGLASGLNGFNFESNDEDSERRLVCKTNAIQEHIHSISLYPFVTVIEKSPERVQELVAPMHGTEWQPTAAPREFSPSTAAAQVRPPVAGSKSPTSDAVNRRRSAPS
jgi:hypothetical protein